MKTTPQNKLAARALAAAVLACLLPLASSSLAQSKTDSSSSSSSASAASAGATPGLDGLIKDGEPKVLDELVQDGLDTLLTRQFAVDNVPEEQQKAWKSLSALRVLNDPNVILDGRHQLELVRDAALGLQAAKPFLPKHAARLEEYARTLVNRGETYYEGSLQYWGENPITQAQLKPIADTVCDLYKMASDAAEDECNAAAAANNLPQAEAFDDESNTDLYYLANCQYDSALAIDSSTFEGKALRKQILDGAISKLKQYDLPTNSVQPAVELMIAKDLMLEGKTEQADKFFQNLIIPGNVTPAPNPIQLDDAYYFKTVASVLAGDAATAKTNLADLAAFQKTLPDLLVKANWKQANIDDTLKDVDTNTQLLQYRIGMLDASQAKNPAAKAQANQAAAQILVALGKQRPELQGLIYEQLVNTLPPNQPTATMDPLLLQAVMSKGAFELNKPLLEIDSPLTAKPRQISVAGSTVKFEGCTSAGGSYQVTFSAAGADAQAQLTGLLQGSAARVQVWDGNGNPLKQTAVNYTPATGGGSITATYVIPAGAPATQPSGPTQLSCDVRDRSLFQRGVDAARELLTRKGQQGITPDMTHDAAKILPAFEESLGDELAAANGYLDFVEKYKTIAKYKDETDPMLHKVYGLLEDVRAANSKTVGLTDAYERFYPIAVTPPFDYARFYFDYGHMLKSHDQFADAALWLKKVPSTDPNYAAARWELLGVDSKLVDMPTSHPEAHMALVNETAAVADEIRTRLANATDTFQRYEAAAATGIAADLAINDQNLPKTALELLDNYEKAVAGLDALNAGDPRADSIEKGMLAGCHMIRYRAHSELNQSDQATNDLLAIMNGASGDDGARMVHAQLAELDQQYNKAQAAKNDVQMRDIARNQAKLSGVLADWAKNNKNPVNQKAYYYYGVAEAKYKCRAGELETGDSAARQTLLNDALAKFKFFASDTGHKMYLDQLDAARKSDPNFDPTLPDPFVLLGLANTQYALHDYLDAQQGFGGLLINKQLGNTSSNAFWEATFKLYDCNYQLALQNNADAKKNLDQTKRGLKDLYIAGGIPAQWRGSFDELCAKMMPDWKIPADTSAPPPQSASSK